MFGYARFDNYEEVMRGLSETNIANLNGEINELLTKWVKCFSAGVYLSHEQGNEPNGF